MSLNVLNIHRRVFVCGATRYPDPAPHLPPEEAIRTYPHFAAARLTGPTVQGGELVFEVDKAPVGVKG